MQPGWYQARGSLLGEAATIAVIGAGDSPLHRPAPTRLCEKRSRAVGDDGAGNRLEQDTSLVRYLIGWAHKDAAWSIHHVSLDTGRNQSHDLLLQQLPITGTVFVPDHQIHCQALQAPVSMCLHQLAHEIDVGWITNLYQHDGQIAGNGIAPQAGLAAAILGEDTGLRTQRRIGVDDRIGEAAVELRIGLGRIDLPQHDLTVGPCQLEDAIGKPAVLVFLHQAERAVASVADARHHVDRGRLLRIQCYAIADSDNRIQYRTLAAR